MTTSIDTAKQESRQIEVPQDSLWRILFMFLWPAIWYTFVIYGLAALFVTEGEKIGSWLVLLIGVIATGAELLAGLLLLRREGYRKGDNVWRERIRWRWPKGRKAWILVIVVFVLAFAASELVPHLADTPGFVPPEWWPQISDPRAEINSAADIVPDIKLQGNYLYLLAATAVTLIFNIFGEEIYYRGYLLPRMRVAFGRWDWVANGVLFTLKHVYQRWLYPGILVGGLAFAFAMGPLGSLPLAMIYHYVGAQLFGTVQMIMATLGLG